MICQMLFFFQLVCGPILKKEEKKSNIVLEEERKEKGNPFNNSYQKTAQVNVCLIQQ